VETSSFSKTVPGQAPQVRLGDAERQDAARELQQHFAEGRLTWEELDERLAQAYAARVKDDLTGLFTDLPALPPPPPPAPTPRSRAQAVVSRVQSRDVRLLVFLAVVAAVAIGSSYLHFLPLILIWSFVAFGRRGGHGGRSHDSRHHDNHHGPHGRGRAWG
jgi:hypothetical protein